MKLKEFNPENTKSIESRGVAAMRLNLKSGLISLNKKAVAQIGLRPGDGFVFVQDEDDPENWYIEKKSSGFVLRRNESTGCCFANNVKMTREICGDVDVVSVKFLIAGQSTTVGKRTLWGVLKVSA